MTRFKFNGWPVFALLILLGIFYPGLFLAKQASLMGDHWEQHYPWAFVMADALKHGLCPFWTPWIQCGYPIVAESQIGLFYLPNLLLYGLLPFHWAYSFLNIFHFFISGVGIYLYSRKMGLSSVGAFVASIVFVFGTGYGGAYYNITSLKTLSWFPWILWSFEEFSQGFRKRYAFLAMFFMSLAILAGYLQVAALMLLICAVYFLFRIFVFPNMPQPWEKRLKCIGGMSLALLGAVILALPQLLLTFQLALLSNRINLTEDYAYVGSLSPLALLTIFFPKLQGVFRGSCLYSGIFAVYFVCAAFFASSKGLRRALWLWGSMGLISLFLALGGWSPLYVALVKITHFYSFRIPAKFLIFFCFAVAFLAGLGAHVWLAELTKAKERLRSLNRFYIWLVSGVLAIWGIVYFFLTVGRSLTLKFGEFIITHFIYGKSGHPRSLDAYLGAVADFADSFRNILALSDPWQLLALALIAVSCLWVLTMRRALTRFRAIVLYLLFAVVVLLADLYVVAGTDMKRDFDSYQNVYKQGPVLETLLSEKEMGRVERIYGFRKESEALPLVPSVNILYGIEDIGGYSPLIMGRYFESIGQFGNVNDSNRSEDPSPSFVLERLPLLNALGVSHVLSVRELNHPDLELLIRDPQTHVNLYRNLADHNRGFFIGSAVSFADWPILKKMLMAPEFDPKKILLLENSEKNKIRGIQLRGDSNASRIERGEHTNDRELWFVETTGPGFFVVPNTMYPGWEATINSQKASLLSAYGLFQCVWIPEAGKYSVEFTYQPYRGMLDCFPGSQCPLRKAS